MGKRKTWTERGGSLSYGKNALAVKIEMEGFDDLLDDLKRMGADVDNACRKAIDSALPIAYDAMRKKAASHKRTGTVYNAIETVKAQGQGVIYGAAGIDLDKNPDAFHAVFEEYGDGHSPGFPDHFISNSVKGANKKRILQKMRETLIKEGIPIE